MERDFKGVWIPKEIWLNEELGWTEKLLLVEIDSLQKNGECFATNEYFAKFLSLSKDRISKLISNLKKLGYIEVKIVYKHNSKQIDKRIITTRGYRQKQLGGIGENNEGGIGENNEDINTDIINTNIISLSEKENEKQPKKENKKFTPPTIDEVKEYCHERNNHVDPEKFIAYYDSVGWFVGKKKMKSWKSAIHLWEKRNITEHSESNKNTSYDISAYENYSIFDDM